MPEPASVALLGIGLSSLFSYRRFFFKRMKDEPEKSRPCSS